MNLSTPISLPHRKPRTAVLVALVPAALVGSLVAILLGASPWLPLALAVALSGLVVIAAESARLMYLVPVFLAVEYRIRVDFGSVTIAELSTVLIGIVLGLRMVSGQAARWPGYARDCALVGLVALAALPSMWFLDNIRSSASSYRDLLLPLLFYLALCAANLERRHVLSIVRLLVLLATAAAALGIAQYLSGQFLFLQSEDDALWQYYKVGSARGSLLGNWLGLRDTLALGLYSGVNNFGAFLLIPCCVAVAWAVSPTARRKERLFWLACAGLQTAALLFTFFRTGLLALAMSALAIFWFRKRPVSRRGVIVTGLGVLGILAATLGSGMLAWDQFATVEGRGYMIRDALDLITRNPVSLLTGGYNEIYFANYDQIQAIHNVGLYLFVRFGMPAALALLAFYWSCLHNCYRAVNKLFGSDRDLALGIFSGAGSTLLFLAQTTSFLDSAQNAMWLLFWLAVGTYLYTWQQHAAIPATERPAMAQANTKPGFARPRGAAG